MNTITKILTMSSLALLTACGGGETKTEAVIPENNMDVDLKKSKALTSEGKFLETYLKGLNKMADAIDSIEDEASAKKAAKKIAKIATDMETFTEKHGDDLNDKKAAMALMTGGRRGEFMELQARLSTGMMKLATQHPEYMGIISKEMEKMPKPGQ